MSFRFGAPFGGEALFALRLRTGAGGPPPFPPSPLGAALYSGSCRRPVLLLARRKVGASANKDAISLVALGAVIDDASSAGRQGVPF